MATLSGGQVVWIFDAETGAFDRALVSMSNKAKDTGSSIGNGLDRSISKGARNAANQLDGVANSLSGVLKTAVAVGIGGSYGINQMVSAAFNQVRAVENARAVMTGYGASVGEVNQALAEAVKFVRSDLGKLFQRDDIINATSALYGMGIQLNKTTKGSITLAKATSAGNGTFDEFLQVLRNVDAAGKLTTDQFQVLASRGVNLDKSLIGTSMSAQTLLDAMEGVLPDSLIAGRANTIDGKLITLRSSFRDLGNQILGVDADTSTFVQGGAGDMLLKMLDELIIQLKTPEMKQAFSTLGKQLATMAQGAIPAIVQAIQFLANNFDKIILAIQILIPTIIGLRTAAAGLRVFSTVAGVFKSARDSASLLNKSFSLLSKNPLILVFTVLAGVFAYLATQTDILDGSFEKLSPVFNAISKAAEPLLTVFGQLASTLGGALAAVLPTLASAFGQILAAIVPLIPPIVQLVTTLLPVLVPIISGLVAVLQVLSPIISVVATIISTVLTVAINALTLVLNAIILVIQAVGNAFVAAWNFIAGVWNGVVGFFSRIWNGIVGIFSVVIGWFGDIFSGAWEGIKTAWSAVKSFFQGVWNGIVGVFNGVTNWFKDIFGKAWNGIKDLWNGAGKFFSGIWDNIKNAFSGAFDLGKNIVEGLWNGISDMVGWIGEKIKGFGENVLGGIKNFFGIKSPSRVMRDEVGKMLGIGLGNGIEESAKYAINSANKVSDEVMKAFSTDMSVPQSDYAYSMDANAQLTASMAPVDPEMQSGYNSNRSNVTIEQTNNVYTELDMDQVNRDLSWELNKL